MSTEITPDSRSTTVGADNPSGGADTEVRYRGGALATYTAAAALGRLSARATTVALILLALERSGSPWMTGIVVALSVLPSLLLGPLVGMMIDRARNPRLYYLLGPLAFGVATVAVAVAMQADLWVLAGVLVFVSGAALPTFEGALTAVLKYLIPAHRLSRGYAMDAGSYSLSSVLAPLVASVTAVIWSPFWAVVVSGAMSVLAVGCVAALAIPRRVHVELAPFRFGQMFDGLRVLVRVPQLRGTTVASTFASLGKDTVMPLAATLIMLGWGRAAEEGGLLLAAHALGGVLGSALVAVIPIRLRRASAILYSALVLTGGIFLVSAFVEDSTVMLVLMFLSGVLNGPMITATIVVRSAFTPDELRTQVFTTAMSLRATSALGALIAGALGAMIGGMGLFVLIGATQLVAAALGVLTARSRKPALRE